MQRKIFIAVAAAVVLGVAVLFIGGHFGLWGGSGHGGNGHGGTASLVPIDHSIKTEYGVPILVRRVIDGDTIELVNGDRVRYIGMDTPEEVDPRKPVQCFAREGAEKNKELVEGKMVDLYKDVTPRDQYGRLLAFVYRADGATSGTFVNLELVRGGFAFNYPFPPDISKEDEFRAAEAAARASGLGLWSACAVYQTASGRSQTNTL